MKLALSRDGHRIAALDGDQIGNRKDKRHFQGIFGAGVAIVTLWRFPPVMNPAGTGYECNNGNTGTVALLQIGANVHFRGDGMTGFVYDKKNAEAIKADGIAVHLDNKKPPQQLGMPELLTIEKNPPSISELVEQKSVLVIPL